MTIGLEMTIEGCYFWAEYLVRGTLGSDWRIVLQMRQSPRLRRLAPTHLLNVL